jgi:hypothetical protein
MREFINTHQVRWILSQKANASQNISGLTYICTYIPRHQLYFHANVLLEFCPRDANCVHNISFLERNLSRLEHFQNETRNKLIEMNLYMEISTLGVTFAACVSSVFGMNLNSGIQEDPYAFYLTTLFIMIARYAFVVLGTKICGT